MKFNISDKIFSLYPSLIVGVLVCRGIDNSGLSEAVIKLIRQREEEIQTQLSSESFSQHPKIKIWRDAYRAFGVKPKEYKSSVESLYRRVMKGDELRHINKIVDIYNYISLQYTIPVGG